MARVSRSRVFEVEPRRIWDLVSDPYSLPRWWPRVLRVEDVHGSGKRARWTTVLETERGTGVRADYRCIGETEGERYTWEQEVAGTPFERILRRSSMEVGVGTDAAGTRVTLTSDESLRGLSRLGATMMRGASRRRLEEALDGIDRALVGDG
jgi:uncharacterized protein YndB with AHSA1/START domain